MMIKEYTGTKNMIERMKMLCVMRYVLRAMFYSVFTLGSVFR